MSAQTPVEERTAPHGEEPGRPSVPIGRLVLGALLVLLGALWLLEALEILDLRWGVVLAAALTVVGLGLLASARRGAHGGLVATGIILSVLVLVSSVLPGTIPLGGIGERSERPASAAEIQDDYDLSMGSLTVDLRALEDVADGAEISARVGMGELVVRLPAGMGAQVSGQAGMGEVVILDRSQGGVGVSLDHEVDGSPTIKLDLSVGMGKVEVRR